MEFKASRNYFSIDYHPFTTFVLWVAFGIFFLGIKFCYPQNVGIAICKAIVIYKKWYQYTNGQGSSLRKLITLQRVITQYILIKIFE